jgi:hypothetical protein
MKTAVLAFLLAASALGQSAPASAQKASPGDPGAKKARELIQQAIEALGGQAYLSVQDMEQEGRAYNFHHGELSSVGTRFWRFWKWPDKERVEVTKQRDIVYINNGDQGYEITYKGTAPEEPSQLEDYNRRRHYALEIVLRQWIGQPGTILLYEGPAVAERKPAESVTILNAKNQAVTLFLDANTHLPVKKVFTWRDHDRYKNEEAEIFDNYRQVQGVMTPQSIVRSRNGEYVTQRFLHDVRYNQGLADALFQATVTYDPYQSERKK